MSATDGFSIKAFTPELISEPSCRGVSVRQSIPSSPDSAPLTPDAEKVRSDLRVRLGDATVHVVSGW